MEDNKQMGLGMKTTKELRNLIDNRVKRAVEEMQAGKLAQFKKESAYDLKRIAKLKARLEAIEKKLKSSARLAKLSYNDYNNKFETRSYHREGLVDRVMVAFQYEDIKLKDMGEAITQAIKEENSLFVEEEEDEE